MKEVLRLVTKNKLLFAVLFVAAVISVLLLIYCPNNPNAVLSDPFNYNRLAKSIAQFHVYSENYQPGGSGNIFGAYRPPGYPIFIALVYLIKYDCWKLVIVAQIGLYLLSLVWLFLLVGKYFSKKVALVTVAIYAAIPTIYFINNSFWTESFALFLVIASLYFYFYLDYLAGWKRFLALATSGVLFGWLILVRPTFLIYLGVVGLLFLINWIRQRKINKSRLIFILFVLIPILVWSIRSTIVNKSLVIISTNGGVNYFLGNNPYVLNGRAAYWPSLDYRITKGIGPNNGLSESSIDQKETRLALEWVTQNPSIFAKLAINKIRYLFGVEANLYGIDISINHFPAEVLRVTQMIAYLLLLFFSLVGLIFLKPKILALWLLPYLMMIILAFGDNRFVVPLLIPMSILAAIALTNPGKIKKKLYLLLIIIGIFYGQFNYFYPAIEKEFILLKEYYLSSRDLKHFIKDTRNYFITDEPVSSEFSNILFKKSVDNDPSRLRFYRGDNEEVREDELIDLINRKVLFTDLTAVFSNIDKTRYPKLINKNYLVYSENVGKPIFLIESSSVFPKISQSLSGTVISEGPGQLNTIGVFNSEGNQSMLFDCELEQNSQIIIETDGTDIVLSNYSGYDRTHFNLRLAPTLAKKVRVSLRNNPFFGNPHNYNIFTSAKKIFQTNGAQINSIGATKDQP